MAVTINKTIEWRAGAGTPIKYQFSINATSDAISRSGNVVTFNLVGTVNVTNHPTNSQNSFAASDIAVLTVGDKDPTTYAFTQGEAYYERALPFLPNAPQDFINAVLVEFRGDTLRPNPNRSSLYLKGDGVVINAINTETSLTIPINKTFQVTLDGSANQPILIWCSSGANNATSYEWHTKDVWASWIEYDYRPGATWSAGWLSHNRSSGATNIYTGNDWRTMRTVGAPTMQGNPPLIHRGDAWYNQYKTGQE